jgi:hypothetical protein
MSTFFKSTSHINIHMFQKLQDFDLTSPLCGQTTRTVELPHHLSSSQEQILLTPLSLCSQKGYSLQAKFCSENEKQKLNRPGKSNPPGTPQGSNQS